eukprot:CAMPEP_0116939684 /NCGR_PEP_ID=MMETSP0467-20121206/32891_1 /TAXON_ID=283647 /ORGANISM="Mesodinium pulex, Strain SPMC105" /LENGTH=68 /DNA_ID=CAMNT_0004622027 /DNA_START=436 /DNA_END=642 /DNA_ORIENTATION=+
MKLSQLSLKDMYKDILEDNVLKVCRNMTQVQHFMPQRDNYDLLETFNWRITHNVKDRGNDFIGKEIFI